MRLDDFDTGANYPAHVLSSQRITPDSVEEVREIVLEVERADFAYQPGQSIGVIVSGSHELGHKHHFRLYSVADTSQSQDGRKPRVTLCVKRCDYLDEYSGERYQGIASNYLCDLSPGDSVTINGPFGIPFEVPEDKTTDLLLIGKPIPDRPIYIAGPQWRASSLRTGRWKLIASETERMELFDIEQDPAEARNLADEEPARLRSMRATLEQISAKDNDSLVK